MVQRVLISMFSVVAVSAGQECEPEIVGSIFTGGGAVDVKVVGSVAVLADDAVRTIDVSDPTNPVLIDDVAVGGTVTEIEVVAGLVYVVTGFGGGLVVVDATDPAELGVIGSFVTPGEAAGIRVIGDLAYVADGFGGLQILDVSDPTKPAPIGSGPVEQYAEAVDVTGSVACVVDTLIGLRLFDVSNPEEPVILGDLALPDSAHDCVEIDGDLAYVSAGGFRFTIVDISDPTAPSVLGSVDTPNGTRGIALSGSKAFVGAEEAGLLAIDISDPANPFLITSVDTPSGAFGVSLQDGVAYVADQFSGMQIVDVSSCVVSDVLLDYGLAPGKGFRTLGGINESVQLQPFTVTDPAWHVQSIGIGGFKNPGKTVTGTILEPDMSPVLEGLEFELPDGFQGDSFGWDDVDVDLALPAGDYLLAVLADGGPDGSVGAYQYGLEGPDGLAIGENGEFKVPVGTLLIRGVVCYPDFNGDGHLNILDFVSFQIAFVNGDELADCDDSGALDILDFICFQGDFQVGCR